MNITIESTKPITLEELSDDKFYALFNSSLFYTYHNEKLKCLAQPLDKKSGSLYVAEGNSEKDVLDFFASNQWKYSKGQNYY